MEVASPLTTLPVGLSPGGGGGDASNMMVGHHHHHHHHHHHLSNKRSLSSYCGSPTHHQSALANDIGGNIFGTLRDSTTDDIDSDDNDQNHPYQQAHISKRRRFHEPSEIDSLSRDFSSHTLFFNATATGSKQQQQKQPQPTQQQNSKSIFSTNGASSTLKRVRMAQFATIRAGSPSRSPSPQEQQLHQQQQQQQQQQSTVLIKKNQELERVIQEQASLIESLQNDKVVMDKSLTSLKIDHERILKDNTILRKAVAIQEERRIHSEQEMKSSKLQSDEKIRSLEQMIMTLRYHLQAASRSNTNDFIHGPRPPDVY